jgi:hypothetical protein
VSTRTATCVVVRHVVIEADGQERITYYGPFLPHVGSAVDAVIAAIDAEAERRGARTWESVVEEVFIGLDESDCKVVAGTGHPNR